MADRSRTAQRRTERPAAPAADPIPLLLVRRGVVGRRLLGELPTDARIELVATTELTPKWVGFADRVAAVLIASRQDPLVGLLYALTAGIRVPIVVAAQPEFRGQRGHVEEAGAAEFLLMPITTSDVDRLVTLLVPRAASSRVDTTLRLVLDSVGQVARYRDRSVKLTQREFVLLHCLSGRQGRPVASDELYRYVWGDSAPDGQSRQILTVYVFQLRKKLARLGLTEALTTVRGFGYALANDSA